MGVGASNRSRVAGASFILFCASLLLIAYSSKNPGAARIGSAMFAEIAGPLQMVTYGSYRGVTRLWDDYVALLGVRDELQQLRERFSQIESQNAGLRELEHENERLRELLNLSVKAELKGLAADVIGVDPSNWVDAISIDRGTSDGVAAGMAVIDGRGVVGQVIAAGTSTSRVLLLIDRSSGVDALVQDSRTRGVVVGSGQDRCEMRYVSRDDEIKVGDRIITSGLDGVFPKGLLVGTVINVEDRSGSLFRSVTLEPAVTFARLESVLVVTGTEPQAAEQQTTSMHGRKSGEQR